MSCDFCSHCQVKQPDTEVFNDLVNALDYNVNKIKYTSGRKNKLKMRLRTFTPEELLTAAKNLANSSWHMGDNPSGIKYATIDFLLRNDEKVDEWLNKTEMVKFA